MTNPFRRREGRGVNCGVSTLLAIWNFLVSILWDSCIIPYNLYDIIAYLTHFSEFLKLLFLFKIWKSSLLQCILQGLLSIKSLSRHRFTCTFSLISFAIFFRWSFANKNQINPKMRSKIKILQGFEKNSENLKCCFENRHK